MIHHLNETVLELFLANPGLILFAGIVSAVLGTLLGAFCLPFVPRTLRRPEFLIVLSGLMVIAWGNAFLLMPDAGEIISGKGYLLLLLMPVGFLTSIGIGWCCAARSRDGYGSPIRGVIYAFFAPAPYLMMMRPSEDDSTPETDDPATKIVGYGLTGLVLALGLVWGSSIVRPSHDAQEVAQTIVELKIQRAQQQDVPVVVKESLPLGKTLVTQGSISKIEVAGMRLDVTFSHGIRPRMELADYTAAIAYGLACEIPYMHAAFERGMTLHLTYVNSYAPQTPYEMTYGAGMCPDASEQES